MKETININKKIKALRLFRKFFFRKETGIYILSGSITSMCILIKIARIIPESLFIKFLLIFIYFLSLSMLFKSNNVIELKINKLIKKEYIKINQNIKYLEYISEECFDDLEHFIFMNKKELELTYEKEEIKKQIDNF